MLRVNTQRCYPLNTGNAVCDRFSPEDDAHVSRSPLVGSSEVHSHDQSCAGHSSALQLRSEIFHAVKGRVAVAVAFQARFGLVWITD